MESANLTVAAFRERVLQLLLAAVDGKGQPRLTGREAEALLNYLTDQELTEGMAFNTPEDVAEVLLGWNPDA